MIIPAHKSNILYKIPVPTYKNILSNAVTEDHKISSHKQVSKVNNDTLNLVRMHEPGLETRVEVFTRAEVFATVEDHKRNFPSKVEVRVLNPAKPLVGKITKTKLQAINSELRCISKLNQLQSTKDAI